MERNGRTLDGLDHSFRLVGTLSEQEGSTKSYSASSEADRFQNIRSSLDSTVLQEERNEK